MKPKSFREYKELYERKTGDKMVLRKDYLVFFLPSRGIMTAKLDREGSMLIIEFVVGDGSFWLDYAELLAREYGLSKIGTFCNRPIEAYIRTMGGDVLVKKSIDGQQRFLCQDKIGRRVLVTFKCDRGEGLEPEYFVTLYLNEKATTEWSDLDYVKGEDNNV